MARISPLLRSAPLGMMLLVACSLVRVGRGEEVMPNSSKECAICHIRWVGAFNRSEVQDTAMKTIMDRKAGSGDMCLSCHDGSVADSRFKVWSTSHHATDVVPSPAVKIPTDRFPLDEQGRMTCATCHTAHAVPNSSDLKTVVFLRQPNVDSSLCLSCHPEHAQKNDFQHPLGYSESPVPAAVLEAGGKASMDGHGIICQTCHEPHGARNAWMLVLPPSELCIACHIQKSPEAKPPAGAPVHRIGHTYRGFEPPASLLAERATFGPGGELSCLSCHRLHDASGAKPLLIRKNEDSSLCLECHPQEKAILGSPHDLRVSSPATVNAHDQEASVSGPCGACHRIHGWARNVPDTGRPHSSGCMECHRTGGPGSVHRPYVESHPVGGPLPEGLSVSLPVDADTNTIGCLTCHDPHAPRTAADTLSTTVAPQEADSRIQPPRSFLRAEGSQLCVVCHQATADSLGSVHDPIQFDPAAREALAMHSSIGPCRVCHTTHNAQGEHLWTRTPASSSAGPLSNLCLACHDQGPLSAPGGTHHPLAKVSSLQGLSESLLVHTTAKSQADGEVGCLTCHDPHQGSGQVSPLHRIPAELCTGCHADRQKVASAVHEPNTVAWGRKLGVVSRGVCVNCHLMHGPKQEMCTRCHAGKEAIIGSMHDAGAAGWGKELGFVSKGVCVDCHPIHEPEQESDLRMALGPANTERQLCQACHQAGFPGPTAETPHMGRTFVRQAGGVPGHPATGSDEMIACRACHDIHQEGQPAKLLRGRRQESDLCLTCHPKTRGLPGSLHDLRRSAPGVANVQGETADRSGPCGVCHLIHSEPDGNGTWAHADLSGSDFAAGYCTACHQQGACAGSRLPGRAGHPDVPILNRTRAGDPDYRPTFDDRGAPSPIGVISCLTCHEPHGMMPPHQAEGNDALPERMFLRPVANQSLCVDCHGIESLWRFLYYHRANRNPRPHRDSGDSQQEP